ncbi:FkbM family methyltransferase [Dactylosporangium salmoneum]|uniref:Methyltransferase FkbM domain-containing protein n=1 Tax=Dactylosporangium salmoneum TaxID=53361 RepID=A0ABN3GNI5_9ACTN
MTAVLQDLRIPKVIHRIWLGGPMPERERDLGESWRRRNPGWQLRVWLDEDVPPLVNQALFDAAGSPARKVDILRYEILLRHGGIAAGADLECRRGLEPLLDGVELLCVREDAFRLTDDLLGCVPGHPAIAAVVAALPDSVATRTGRSRDEQTGPELLTRVVVEQEALGGPAATVLGPERFFPYHWTEPHRAAEPFPDAYTVRRWNTSAASLHRSDTADPPKPAPVVAPPAADGVARVVVLVDPDLAETAAVVLAGAVEVAAALPGSELALVVKGVPRVTEAVGEAMAGLVRQLAGRRELPDVVVYAEAEGDGLGAVARVGMSASPADNARALLALASAVAPPSPAPAPAVPANLGRKSMHGTYIGNDRMLIELAYGGMLVVPSDDYSLMPALTTWGAIEPPLTRYFATAVHPGQTVVDVGANVGYFTVLAARQVGAGGRVVAFEANPATAGLLRDNLSLNWLTDHDIVVRTEAAYSGNGSIGFHASSRFVGDSSTQRRPEHEHRLDDITTIQVPAVRLDDALAHLPHIDLLKIDIEGGEFHAFQGMMGLIRARRIGRIVFEWNAVMLGEDRAPFAGILRTIRDECGGGFYALDQEGRPAPLAIDQLEQVPFYPFALIDFS